MNIYFSGSIRGGRQDVDLYLEIIEYLKLFGEVFTEHVGDKTLAITGEDGIGDQYIHGRDMAWMLSSDVVVAEVTQPSLGVGYEIGRAVEQGKKILCLYRPQEGKKLSAMITGCPVIHLAEYDDIAQTRKIIDDFFKQIDRD